MNEWYVESGEWRVKTSLLGNNFKREPRPLYFSAPTTHHSRFCRVPLGFLSLAFLATGAFADEGMWLFNRPPKKELQERYGFDPTPEWLAHVQKSSVRFNNGGSGSFVSADGLVMTNHHVGADCLQKLSDAAHNYLHDGFYAKTRAEEKRCLDLELNVLESIEDVTARVNAAVKPGMPSDQAFLARRAVMNEIENESTKKTGLRSDVVTLYQGGEYDLYRYKRYTDVRLVFAPEQQIAFFGGDPDNFEYPRFDLDMCFFRVYEEGQTGPSRALQLEQGRRGRQRARLRPRQSGPHRTARHGCRVALPPRHRFSLSASAALPLGGDVDRVERAVRRERPPSARISVQRAEQPQGPRWRFGRPAGSRAHGQEKNGRGAASRRRREGSRPEGLSRGLEERGGSTKGTSDDRSSLHIARARRGLQQHPIRDRADARAGGRQSGRSPNVTVFGNSPRPGVLRSNWNSFPPSRSTRITRR